MKKLMSENAIERSVQFGIYALGIYIFIILKAVPYFNNDIFICVGIILLTYFLGKDFIIAYKNFLDLGRVSKKLKVICLIVCSMIISFSIGANDWFYHQYWGYWDFNYKGAFCYLLMCIYVMILCIVINYWITCKEVKNNSGEKIHKYFKYIVFGIFFSSGILYLIAYNPAHMHADTYMQLRQVFGIDQLYDWHPVFHTLLIKIFLRICDTPAFFALFHISLFSYVMTLWLIKFEGKGVNAKVLIAFSCSFYLNIAYGFLITDIWKDNLYNIFVIWVSYLIYEMIDNYTSFDKRLFNYFAVIVCVIGIDFVRHNGIVAVLFVLALLGVKGIQLKNKKFIGSFFIICIICFFIKPYSYRKLDVIPNENGIKYIPIVHDIASFFVYDEGKSLPVEVQEEMLSILPLDQWVEKYASTDSDGYTFHTENFLPNLSKKTTGEMLSIYIKTGIREPVRLVAARLMSSQQLWSVFKREGSGDYLGEKFNDPALEDMFGYKRIENVLTYIADNMYDIFEHSKFLNTLFFRTGVWFALLVLAVFITIVNEQLRKFIIVLLPIAGYSISLFIAMTCQNLRYVWAVFIISALYLMLVKAECGN